MSCLVYGHRALCNILTNEHRSVKHSIQANWRQLLCKHLIGTQLDARMSSNSVCETSNFPWQVFFITVKRFWKVKTPHWRCSFVYIHLLLEFSLTSLIWVYSLRLCDTVYINNKSCSLADVCWKRHICVSVFLYLWYVNNILAIAGIQENLPLSSFYVYYLNNIRVYYWLWDAVEWTNLKIDSSAWAWTFPSVRLQSSCVDMWILCE